jgi:hypothetical protein
LPPGRVAEGFIDLLQIMPHTQEALLGGLDDLSSTANVLAEKMSASEIERCYDASLSLVNELPDIEQVQSMVPITQYLGGRLSAKAARSSFEQLWTEVEKISTPYPVDEVPASESMESWKELGRP